MISTKESVNRFFLVVASVLNVYNRGPFIYFRVVCKLFFWGGDSPPQNYINKGFRSYLEVGNGWEAKKPTEDLPFLFESRWAPAVILGTGKGELAASPHFCWGVFDQFNLYCPIPYIFGDNVDDARKVWTKWCCVGWIPSRKLTYPPKMAFWRWFSFSQGGIC